MQKVKKLKEDYESNKANFGTSEERNHKVTESIDSAIEKAEEVLNLVKDAIENFEKELKKVK